MFGMVVRIIIILGIKYMITLKEKETIKKAQDFSAKLILKMGEMDKREREDFWRGLSNFEKDILFITFFKKLI